MTEHVAADYGTDLDLDHDRDYQAELVKLAIADALAQRLCKLDLSRTEFASLLGVSQARVTQILAGYSNFTVETLVSAALALDAKIRIELIPNVRQPLLSAPELEPLRRKVTSGSAASLRA